MFGSYERSANRLYSNRAVDRNGSQAPTRAIVELTITKFESAIGSWTEKTEYYRLIIGLAPSITLRYLTTVALLLRQHWWSKREGITD